MRLPAPVTADLVDAARPRHAARGLLHPLTIALPALPPGLAGCTLLHVTDLHVRRRRRRFDALLELLRRQEVDLLLLTGDFMSVPGDENAAYQLLDRLVAAARTRVGTFGVWGNHDSAELRDRCRSLAVHWLENDAAVLDELPITLLGVDCGTDECRSPQGCLRTTLGAIKPRPSVAETVSAGVGAAEGAARGAGAEGNVGAACATEGRGLMTDADDGADDGADRLQLLLAHVPSWLPRAAEAEVDLMLSGHTHGGQVRLPWIGPLLNATPGWPLRLSSGLLRHRDTYAVVSRGVGESILDGFRFGCPPHVPLLTLEHAEDAPSPAYEGPYCVQRW